MRHYLLAFTLVLVLSKGFVAWADPYGAGTEGTYAHEADIKEDLWDARSDASGLVLGSSRLTLIDPDDLTDVFGSDGFNFAFARGGPADLVAVLDHTQARGHEPAWLLVGIDPVRYLGYLTDNEEFDGAGDPFIPSRTALVDSFHILAGLAEPSRNDYAADGERLPRDAHQIDPDPERWALRFRIDFRNTADDQVPWGTFYMRDEPVLRDDRLRETHGRLVDQVEAGVEVLVVLPPMHDTARQRIAETETWRLEQEVVVPEILSWCDDGIGVLDLRDPATYGGSSDGLYDGWHPTKAENQQWIDALADGELVPCSQAGPMAPAGDF